MFGNNNYDYTIKIFNWTNDDQAIAKSDSLVKRSSKKCTYTVSKDGPERTDLLLLLIPVLLLVFHYGIFKLLFIVTAILGPGLALIALVNFASKYFGSSEFNSMVGKSQDAAAIAKSRVSSRVWVLSALLVIGFAILGVFWR